MSWVIIGYIASVLTAVQLIPQTIKAIRSKNLSSVSLTSFGLVAFTAFLWMLYGFHLQDGAIVFANLITFICAIIIVGRKLTHK